MNLLEVFSPIEHNVLTEKLGTLTKLKMPKLIQVMKQQMRRQGRGKGYVVLDDLPSKGEKDGYGGSNANRFKREYGTDIGASSEIIDIGVIKKGVPDIRKAYKEHPTASAFALYVDDKPVAFGRFNSDQLASASRTGVLAYDITAFQSKIDELDKATDAGKSEYQRSNGPTVTKSTTLKTKEIEKYDYSTSSYKKIYKDTAGDISSTGELMIFIDMLKHFGAVTAKIVLAEPVDKFRKRQENRPATKLDVQQMRQDLMLRLKKYKLSKKPTVDNIMDFIKATEKGTGSLQFAGRTYSLQKKDGYTKLSPSQILQGKVFEIIYDSLDPGSFSKVNVSYSFDKETALLMPVSVKWTEYDENNKAISREEVLNDPVWLKSNQIDHSNKDDTIKKLLTAFKAEKYSEVEKMISVLRKEKIDWPELKTIEKSIEIEKKKAAEKKD